MPTEDREILDKAYSELSRAVFAQPGKRETTSTEPVEYDELLAIGRELAKKAATTQKLFNEGDVPRGHAAIADFDAFVDQHKAKFGLARKGSNLDVVFRRSVEGAQSLVDPSLLSPVTNPNAQKFEADTYAMDPPTADLAWKVRSGQASPVENSLFQEARSMARIPTKDGQGFVDYAMSGANTFVKLASERLDQNLRSILPEPEAASPMSRATGASDPAARARFEANRSDASRYLMQGYKHLASVSRPGPLADGLFELSTKIGNNDDPVAKAKRFSDLSGAVAPIIQKASMQSARSDDELASASRSLIQDLVYSAPNMSPATAKTAISTALPAYIQATEGRRLSPALDEALRKVAVHGALGVNAGMAPEPHMRRAAELLVQSPQNALEGVSVGVVGRSVSEGVARRVQSALAEAAAANPGFGGTEYNSSEVIAAAVRGDEAALRGYGVADTDAILGERAAALDEYANRVALNVGVSEPEAKALVASATLPKDRQVRALDPVATKASKAVAERARRLSAVSVEQGNLTSSDVAAAIAALSETLKDPDRPDMDELKARKAFLESMVQPMTRTGVTASRVVAPAMAQALEDSGGADELRSLGEQMAAAKRAGDADAQARITAEKRRIAMQVAERDDWFKALPVEGYVTTINAGPLPTLGQMQLFDSSVEGYVTTINAGPLPTIGQMQLFDSRILGGSARLKRIVDAFVESDSFDPESGLRDAAVKTFGTKDRGESMWVREGEAKTRLRTPNKEQNRKLYEAVRRTAELADDLAGVAGQAENDMDRIASESGMTISELMKLREKADAIYNQAAYKSKLEDALKNMETDLEEGKLSYEDKRTSRLVIARIRAELSGNAPRTDPGMVAETFAWDAGVAAAAHGDVEKARKIVDLNRLAGGVLEQEADAREPTRAKTGASSAPPEPEPEA